MCSTSITLIRRAMSNVLAVGERELECDRYGADLRQRGAVNVKVLWPVLPRRRWRGLAVHLRYSDVYAFCHHVRAEVRRRLGFDSPDRPAQALPLSIWAAAPDSPATSD